MQNRKAEDRVKKNLIDWIKKYLPVIIIVAIGIATVVFIVWLVSLPMPTPPGY